MIASLLHKFIDRRFMIASFLKQLDEAGYSIVPKEPTEEMVDGAINATKIGWLDIPGSKLTVNREKAKIRYRAMLEQAPKVI